MPEQTAADAITGTWRAESARLVGALTRMTRDITFAEDLAQDALVAALEQWPLTGVPSNPAAWLMTIAKRRGIDQIRRAETLGRKTDEIGRALQEGTPMPDLSAQIDYIEDDALRLIFLSCHPVLTPESRAALTLRVVGGLTTGEIARGYLVPEKTMGQRISRAKKTLAQANAEFELPSGPEREQRRDDVMAVIYLIFTEGYSATSGDDWTRPELTAEAIRLARMLAALVPNEPDTHGLHALLEFQGSRIDARYDQFGDPVLLDDQDRSRWDRPMIRRGQVAFAHAEGLAAGGAAVGKYFLQAAIAAQHARADTAADTNWRRIAALYDALARAAPGPVVEVNRAVAHGRAFGAAAGRAVLDAVDPDALGSSAVYPSVLGDLLEQAGDHRGAAEQFTLAAARTDNLGQRRLLERRALANGGRPID